jgi:hypothetical protein
LFESTVAVSSPVPQPQFDTRPASLGATMIGLLPDRLLPRERRRYMRRYRRDAEWIAQLATCAGLTVAWERGERTH